MSKVLILNPPCKSIYKNAEVKVTAPYKSVTLAPAVMATPLLKRGINVKIIDFNLPENTKEKLVKTLKLDKPDFVAITFNTALFHIVKELCRIIKGVNNSITIIGGGAHTSSMPKETLKESLIDISVIGEGDFTLLDVLSKNIDKVEGICYKKGNNIVVNKPRKEIKNLDKLPLPAWQLYDLDRYKLPKIVCRKNPLGFLETSRGCVFDCSYCNKSVFGKNFRYKSVKRIMEEIRYMLEIGFKEINIVDDGFTTVIERAKEVCRRIIKEKLNFSWQLMNGIRVDKVDKELFYLLKKAGCYRVAFGIESGNTKVLEDIRKNTKLSQVRNAVKWANRAGIETWGHFILGLPKDNEETMYQTINFAKSLKLTLANFTICIPYPGTPLFRDYDKRGLIKSKNWKDYNLYEPRELYKHPYLDWDIIYKYYRKAYRSFYFRPGFIIRRGMFSIKQGTFLEDLRVFLLLFLRYFQSFFTR